MKFEIKPKDRTLMGWLYERVGKEFRVTYRDRDNSYSCISDCMYHAHEVVKEHLIRGEIK